MQYNRSITATVYVVNGDAVLLHKHKKYKTWFALGGHLEAGELPHEAALREVFEESGFAVTLVDTETAPHIELARVNRVPAPFCLLHEGIGSDEEFLDFIYIAETGETVPHPKDEESREFKWFTREELIASDMKVHIKNTALSVLEFWQTRGKNE